MANAFEHFLIAWPVYLEALGYGSCFRGGLELLCSSSTLRRCNTREHLKVSSEFMPFELHCISMFEVVEGCFLQVEKFQDCWTLVPKLIYVYFQFKNGSTDIFLSLLWSLADNSLCFALCSTLLQVFSASQIYPGSFEKYSAQTPSLEILFLLSGVGQKHENILKAPQPILTRAWVEALLRSKLLGVVNSYQGNVQCFPSEMGTSGKEKCRSRSVFLSDSRHHRAAALTWSWLLKLALTLISGCEPNRILSIMTIN